MKIPIILGTGRRGRESEKAAKLVLKIAKKEGFDSEIIDVRDYAFCLTDNTKRDKKAKMYVEKIKESEGIIIVSPEYNNGYPGELKLLLDSAYEEYSGKFVGICGVSFGGFGGVRCVQQLRHVCIELRMYPIRDAVYFSEIGKIFDKKGNLKDKSYEKRISKFLNSLRESLNHVI